MTKLAGMSLETWFVSNTSSSLGWNSTWIVWVSESPTKDQTIDRANELPPTLCLVCIECISIRIDRSVWLIRCCRFHSMFFTHSPTSTPSFPLLSCWCDTPFHKNEFTGDSHKCWQPPCQHQYAHCEDFDRGMVEVAPSALARWWEVVMMSGITVKQLIFVSQCCSQVHTVYQWMHIHYVKWLFWPLPRLLLRLGGTAERL
jgi:hypothetical protein